MFPNSLKSSFLVYFRNFQNSEKIIIYGQELWDIIWESNQSHCICVKYVKKLLLYWQQMYRLKEFNFYEINIILFYFDGRYHLFEINLSSWYVYTNISSHILEEVLNLHISHISYLRSKFEVWKLCTYL